MMLRAVLQRRGANAVVSGVSWKYSVTTGFLSSSSDVDTNDSLSSGAVHRRMCTSVSGLSSLDTPI